MPMFLIVCFTADHPIQQFDKMLDNADTRSN